MVTIEQLTPAERNLVQTILLRRWLSLRYPKGTRRKVDAPRVVVQRFNRFGRKTGY